jgi:hypothetical protein
MLDSIKLDKKKIYTKIWIWPYLDHIIKWEADYVMIILYIIPKASFFVFVF